ncbi:MAG: aminotransferase class V-fold PLP-dependent enzyme [Spirochaetes bacterium]|nr:aminotransferase class V-fold PLP-dependent enzyme [Spirochaetota bacterium]
MDINTIEQYMNRFNPRLVAFVLGAVKKVPYFRKMIKAIVRKESAAIMKELEGSIKPYRRAFAEYASLPATGRPRKEIRDLMRKIKSREEGKWKNGFVSGAVYHGDAAHIEFLNEIYAINSQTNPLHSDVWPSIAKYEAEIVSMTAAMLGAGSDSGVCGTVTSGGTESILLAMKSYRDRAREERGIKKPEMIVPVTVHAAFDKASQYFNIRMIKVPVDDKFRADVKAVRRAITRRTIVIVGSAPSFPHGMVDPIEEMSELARKKKIGFHTDACLGGFILPWIERLGYPVPSFDFRLPGVTSISADTHKYGYAAKGTSVILYRDPELRHYQFYKTSEWPGGLYFSPTFAGSRPGALSAACWAAMVSLGEKGYLDAAGRIVKTAEKIKKGIEKIPGLRIMGDPLWVVAFASDELNIYRVMDFMTTRGWSLNGLHKPSCVHICVTLRHTRPRVAERFLKDLRAAVDYVRKNPGEKGDMAPVYGMAASFPDRTAVTDMLDAYLDTLYKV